MDLADRLRDAMENKGFRQSKLAELASVPEETLSRILTRVTMDPRVFTLKKLADPLDVTIGWLLGEKGYEISGDDRGDFRSVIEVLERLLRETQPVKRGAMEPNVAPVILARKPPVHAPRRSKVRPVSATDWRESFGDRTEDSDVEIPTRYAARGANLAFRAEGESMEGEHIADGDLLFVRQESDPRAARGKIVVAVVDGSPYVKRLDYAGNRVRLISAHERHPPMEFDEQSTDWSLVGVVVGWSHDVR
jgi:SOS-response transcriptional repressor LexA